MTQATRDHSPKGIAWENFVRRLKASLPPQDLPDEATWARMREAFSAAYDVGYCDAPAGRG